MSIAPIVESQSDSETVLLQAEANMVAVRQVGFERLRIARDWALANAPDPEQLARAPICARSVGVTGVLVLQYVEAELAAALGIQPITALRLMGDAVDIDTRLPLTWAALADGAVEVWVARKIADLTSALDKDRAGWVEAQVAEVLGTLPPGRLLKLVEARVKQADPELADRLAVEQAKSRGVWRGRDSEHGTGNLLIRASALGITRLHDRIDQIAHLLREHCPELAGETMEQLRARAAEMLGDPMAVLKLLIGAGEDVAPEVVADAIRKTNASRYRPRTTCYVHFTPETLQGNGVARAEELGALTRQQLIDLLGHEHITLKPVIDLNTEIAADCYEVPAKVSEQLRLAGPADCFPYAQSVSRKQDQDHTIAYQWTGPPGQTRLSNLGNMVRRHHRIKTHGGWRVWQHQGRFTWISPHGRIYLTDARGTHHVEIHTGEPSFDVMLSGDYALAS